MAKGIGEQQAWQKAKSFVKRHYGWEPSSYRSAFLLNNEEEWEFGIEKPNTTDEHFRVLVSNKFPFQAYDDTDEMDPPNQNELATGVLDEDD